MDELNNKNDKLISEQAAIDALKEKVFSNLTDEFYGAMQVLDELPSAQPEIKCIAKVTLTDEQVKEAIEKAKCEILAAQPEQDEWCTDCKEYDSEKHCCHRWSKVIRNTVNELSAAWQWTPVEDSPKRSGWYIVTKRFGNGETWIGTKWYSTAYGWNGDGILAWMELPEAYKEGE